MFCFARYAGSRAIAGAVSFSAIESGMFQYGLNTTLSISSLKSGVSLPGLPTTTRMSITVLSSLRASRWKYGTLTMKWCAPNSSGIQRQRSRLSSTCWMRFSIGTFIAVSVGASTMPDAFTA